MANMASPFFLGGPDGPPALRPIVCLVRLLLRLGLLLLPGTVAGFAVSHHLAAVLDRGWTRTVVLSLTVLSAIVVLVDWLLSR